MKFRIVGGPAQGQGAVVIESKHTASFKDVFKKIEKELKCKGVLWNEYQLHVAHLVEGTKVVKPSERVITATDTPDSLGMVNDKDTLHYLMLRPIGSGTTDEHEVSSQQHSMVGERSAPITPRGGSVAQTTAASVTQPRGGGDRDHHFRERMTALYLKYDSSQAYKVDLALDRYVGFEEDVIQELVRKYGPEPSAEEAQRLIAANTTPSPAAAAAAPATQMTPNRKETTSTSVNAGHSFHERLTAIYAKYEPAKLTKVNGTLKKFAGREEAVIRQLVKLYGPEPPIDDAAEHPSSQPLTPRSVTEADSNAMTPRTDERSAPLSSPRAKVNEGYSYEDRLTAMYKVHDPEKVRVVRGTLKKFEGKEEAVIRQLVKKYGYEPVIGRDVHLDGEQAPTPAAAQAPPTDPPVSTASVETIAPTPVATAPAPVEDEPTAAPAQVESAAPPAPLQERTYRERLIAIYTKYDTRKLATVEGTLKKFKGKEEQAIRQLVQRYGPEPAEPVERDVSMHRQAIIEILKEYDPTHLDIVDALLEKYVGREDEVVKSLLEKYHGSEANPREAVSEPQNDDSALDSSSPLRPEQQQQQPSVETPTSPAVPVQPTVVTMPSATLTSSQPQPSETRSVLMEQKEEEPQPEPEPETSSAAPPALASIAAVDTAPPPEIISTKPSSPLVRPTKVPTSGPPPRTFEDAMVEQNSNSLYDNETPPPRRIISPSFEKREGLGDSIGDSNHKVVSPLVATTTTTTTTTTTATATLATADANHAVQSVGFVSFAESNEVEEMPAQRPTVEFVSEDSAHEEPIVEEPSAESTTPTAPEPAIPTPPPVVTPAAAAPSPGVFVTPVLDSPATPPPSVAPPPPPAAAAAPVARSPVTSSAPAAPHAHTAAANTHLQQVGAQWLLEKSRKTRGKAVFDTWVKFYACKKAEKLLRDNKTWKAIGASYAAQLNDEVRPPYVVSDLAAHIEDLARRPGQLPDELVLGLRDVLDALKQCLKASVVEISSEKDTALIQQFLSTWNTEANLCPVQSSDALLTALRQAARFIRQVEDIMSVSKRQSKQLVQLTEELRDVKKHGKTGKQGSKLELWQSKVEDLTNENGRLREEMNRLQQEVSQRRVVTPRTRSGGASPRGAGGAASPAMARYEAAMDKQKDEQITKLHQELAKSRSQLHRCKEQNEELRSQLKGSEFAQERLRKDLTRASQAVAHSPRSARRRSPSMGDPDVSPIAQVRRSMFSDPNYSPQPKVPGPTTTTTTSASPSQGGGGAALPKSRYMSADMNIERGPCPNCLAPLTSVSSERRGKPDEPAAYCFDCKRSFTFGELLVRDKISSISH